MHTGCGPFGFIQNFPASYLTWHVFTGDDLGRETETVMPKSGSLNFFLLFIIINIILINIIIVNNGMDLLPRKTDTSKRSRE